MSIISFISKDQSKQAENKPDVSAMSRHELDSEFSPDHWDELSYDERRNCIQELENRFAQEQRRPAKTVNFEKMDGGRYGYWSKSDDCIYINESLVKDSAFQRPDGHLVPQNDANYQIYDTIAHEGYHAYQSYALDNPGVHADQQQLEEWRLNSEYSVQNGHYEGNYYSWQTAGDRYRIQPLERDAFDYGNSKTREAFDAIEAEEGELSGYDDYKDTCEFDSYDNALKRAQARDPQTLSHMSKEMQDRSEAWKKGESRGQIGQDPSYYSEKQETEEQDQAVEQEDMESLYGEKTEEMAVPEETEIQEDMESLYGKETEEMAAPEETEIQEDMESLYGGAESGESAETGESYTSTNNSQENGISQ